MKKKTSIFILIIISILSVSLYFTYFSKYVMPWQKEEAIKTTLIWAGLNDLPPDSKIMHIEKRGSIFTRQFILEFKSSKNEIKNWIDNSKRLKNNIPNEENGNLIYEIYPGEENSYGGTVKIKNDIVEINVSWS